MLNFLGHFHPVLVHLPIGFLLMAMVFYVMVRWRKREGLRLAIRISLLLGSAFALLSSITGYLLSLSGDYEKGAVQFHQNMGLISTAVSMGAIYAVLAQPRKWLADLSMGLLLVCIVWTGHLGGSITHGSHYLSWGAGGGSGEVQRKTFDDINQARVYEDLVQPVFDAKCYTCHGPGKQKGKLRVDGIAALLRGGKDGIVVTAGKADESELLKRMRLSPDNEDHMPPKEKSQVDADDIALIHWWIESGMPVNTTAGALPQNPAIKRLLKKMALPPASEERLTDYPDRPVEAISQATIDSLLANGWRAVPLAAGNHYLHVYPVSGRSIHNANLGCLLMVKKQLVWLDLSGTEISDSASAIIKQLSGLYRLYLRNTDIGDTGVEALSVLPELRHLNLSGTRVTQNSIKKLAAMKHLRSLYLYQAPVDHRNWAALQQLFPKTLLDSGNYVVPMLATDTELVK